MDLRKGSGNFFIVHALDVPKKETLRFPLWQSTDGLPQSVRLFLSLHDVIRSFTASCHRNVLDRLCESSFSESINSPKGSHAAQ